MTGLKYLALFCAVLWRADGTAWAHIACADCFLSFCVFNATRSTILRNAAELRGPGPSCGLPAGKLPLSLYCYGGPVSPSGQQSLSLQHSEDLIPLHFFFSACALHVYFL